MIETKRVKAVTGKSDSIANCCHFSSPSAAFPSSTFPSATHTLFISHQDAGVMERKVLQENSALLLTIASSIWQALLLGSPPLKNNQHFSLSWEFSLKTVGSVLYFLLRVNPFLSSGWRTCSFCLAPPQALIECLIPRQFPNWKLLRRSFYTGAIQLIILYCWDLLKPQRIACKIAAELSLRECRAAKQKLFSPTYAMNL